MARMVDVKQSLVSISGEELKQPSDKEGTMEPLRVEDILIGVLLTPDTEKKETKGKEKVRRFKLAQKIHDSSEVEFEVEDLSLLKKLVGEMHAPLIVGQIWHILDPKEEDEKGDDDAA